MNGQKLFVGDAKKFSDETQLTLSEGDDAEVLVFDLAPDHLNNLPVKS